MMCTTRSPGTGSRVRAPRGGAPLWALIAGVLPARALASPEPSPPAAAAAPAAAAVAAPAGDRASAQELFRQGNVHYELGDYPRAIEQFRRSYQLAREPTLLFNLAQAYRLSGDCRRSIDSYRQFARLTEDPALRFKAEAQIEALQPTCAPPAVSVSSAPAPGVDLARVTAHVALWTGAAALAGAAGAYAWNHDRYRRWRREDRALAAQGEGLAPAEAFARRDRNDGLLRSIERTDRLAAGLAVVGGVAAVAGGSLLLLWPRRGPRDRLALTFDGTSLRLGVGW
jgi:tetratricopeptide (TPR) repeat protein